MSVQGGGGALRRGEGADVCQVLSVTVCDWKPV